MSTESAPKEPICNHCGSTEVLADAWASWDIEKQEWVLHNVFDATYCETCDGEVNITWRPTQ